MSRSWYDLAPLQRYIEQDFILLTPNFRLARSISAQWDAQRMAAGERAWEPLAVQPLESWLLQRWEQALAMGLVPARVPLQAGQALERWQQAIAQEEEQSGAYNLLRPSAAAELCHQARDTLLRWQVDTGSGAVRQLFTLDDDCATYLKWQQLFERLLDGAGQCMPVDCIVQLLACAAQLPQRPAVLLEFDDVPPLYHATTQALCERVEHVQTAEGSARLVAHNFADKRAELKAVARWAATAQRQQPQHTLAIVLTDMSGDRAALEYLLRSEFDCLGDNYASLPVNFSTGITLDRAPAIRDALAVLALGGQTTTVSALVAIMQSRFLALPDAQSALSNRFINRLYEGGRHELSLGDVRHQASRVSFRRNQAQADAPANEPQGLVLGERLMAMVGMRELQQPARPSAWVERFTAILDIWEWPGTGLDSLEFQQLELWYRTLDEYAGYDGVCASLDFGAALQLLRRCCERQMSQPSTSDSNLQVLGPLEAAGLRFDEMWLCGMQAASWPAPARPSPFIPHSLQRERQMPHGSAEREWVFAETLLNQYRGACSILHASYCEQVDGVGEMPSALLADFERETADPPPAVDPDWLQQWQLRRLEALDDHCAPIPDVAELAAIGGGSGLLEDQSHCPFRAFSKRRLRVEPLGEFSVALSPAERGSLLHDALYALWGEIGDHASLLALQGAARADAIQRAIQAALEAMPSQRRRGLGHAYCALEAEHLQHLLGEWLMVEEARTEFVVLQREQAVSLSLGQLNISLRVDRIDQLPAGGRVIVDYKTGVSKVGDWLGERPAKPQLLLYGIAEPTGAAALAFAQIRPRDCRYAGIGESAVAPGVSTDLDKLLPAEMGVADWPALNTWWRQNLERLAAEFVAGDARVDPLGRASCTWCGLQPLCRIDLDQQVQA